MKQSTKNIFKKHGLRIDRAIHNYIYFVFYRPYVKYFVAIGVFIFKKLAWFRPASIIPRFIMNGYHAKILSKSDVTKILTLKEDVVLGPDHTKRIVPYKYANSIIFKDPDHIAVMDCPCKTALKSSCKKPINCCIAVGKQLVEFWVDHCEKYNARRINSVEAIELIDECRRTGHITQAFFKTATGGHTGVICNCCPECCGALAGTRVVQKMKGGENLSMSAASGYKIKLDKSRCALSGDCAAICPFGAIRIDNGKRTYNPDLCMGCGLCVEQCSKEALSIVLEKDGLYPLDIDLVKEKLG